MDVSHIPGRLAEVRARIGEAAARSGRHPDEVRLVAVSKTFPAEAVRAAADAGQRDFGENKVQEGLQKIEQLADTSIRWHLIGHLQSNKARKAAAGFGTIHAVDSPDLLRKLDQAAVAAGTTPELLVQVDLALEPTKHGAALDTVPALFEAASGLQAARVVGLMLLPPLVDDPEDARPWFRSLRDLRDGLAASGVPAARLRELSMGMSHDFEVAIEEGATMVRVGTAIFGRR
ncbi:MAG: YggS family pyridoxal phosphate-dependent enzyme [Vicinamibacterales bacterium]